MKRRTIETFTDGASRAKGNKRIACSSAFLVVEGNTILGKGTRYMKGGTNNVGELIAVEILLDYLIQEELTEHYIHIYTDSQIVYYTFTKWIEKWIDSNWIKTDRRPVVNKKIIERIYNKTFSFTSIEWHWVRGHAGNKFNEMADELCRKAIE